MMLTDVSRELPDALRRALRSGWDIRSDGGHLEMRHRDHGTPYRPPRRVPDWPDLLDRLEAAFREQGVARAPALPLRWRRETDLTISAVQALDPYLKDRRPYTYRTGYLPQPVVRFTGKRELDGRLRDGFLTSFVNVSRVEPITGIHDHAAILDSWIGVLSRLGLHARHIEVFGSLQVWERPPVAGVTLRFRHAGLELGDIVLLWNQHDPSYLVTDLGTGLERLRWAIGRASWAEVIHGRPGQIASPDLLDAIRTAVLLIGSGVDPAARGPGSAARRVLKLIENAGSFSGLHRSIRSAHSYWQRTTPGLRPWPEIATRVEQHFQRI